MPPIDMIRQKTKDTVPEQTSWAANIDRGEGSCREPRLEMMVDDDLIFLDYVKRLFNARKIDQKNSSEARLGQKTSAII